jgi:hypothetical protein
LLEARAQFDAPERSVHVRIAEHDDHIFLDLADEHWRAVEIGPDGWRVIGCPPVCFRRPAGMLPLPAPEHWGSIDALLPFLNLSGRNDFMLVVAWLRGPYPLLARISTSCAGTAFEDNVQGGLVRLMGTCSPGHGSERPQTMLTVLTQTSAFVLSNRSEDYPERGHEQY